jgi:hypothetical protein
MRQAIVLWLTAAILISSSLGGEPADNSEGERRLRALESAVDVFSARPGDATPEQRVSRGVSVNQAFVVLTGEAVNPLFGITALGIHNYLRAGSEERDSLPVYDQPVVWGPLLAIILLMFFNATICGWIPFLNTPLNVLGSIVNAGGAAAVLPLALKVFADSLAEPAGKGLAWAADALFPCAMAAEAGGGGSFWLSLGWLAGVVLGLFSYVAVWLVFYSIDALTLLSPWGILDALLKGFRLSVMGLLAGLYHLYPEAAQVMALALVLISACLSVWAVRKIIQAWRFIFRLLFSGVWPLSRLA